MLIRKKKPGFLVLLLVISACWGAGCENSFDPLQENNDYHFSMFGALDLSADTQWVRVMPVRDTLLTEINSVDAEVTLTNENNGETVVLNDSLFVFTLAGGVETHIWNFWTTYALEEGGEYTVKAEASDGRSSSATVTIPSDFPVPLLNYNENTTSGVLNGSGVNRLVVAESIYYYRIPTEIGLSPQAVFRVSQIERDRVSMHADGTYDVRINDIPYIGLELGVPTNQVFVDSAEVLLVSGNSSWPDLVDISEEESNLPDVTSNVDNGLGLIAGIVSLKIPFRDCTNESGETVPCPPKKNSLNRSLVSGGR